MRVRKAVTWEPLRVDLKSHKALEGLNIFVDSVELEILSDFANAALASISSPQFSEFTLILMHGRPEPSGKTRRTTWGTGWKAVDKSLSSNGTSFNIHIIPREMTKEATKLLFPLLASRKLLSVIPHFHSPGAVTEYGIPPHQPCKKCERESHKRLSRFVSVLIPPAVGLFVAYLFSVWRSSNFSKLG